MPDNVKQGKSEKLRGEIFQEISKRCDLRDFKIINKSPKYVCIKSMRGDCAVETCFKVDNIMSAITSHIREGSEAAAEKISKSSECVIGSFINNTNQFVPGYKETTIDEASALNIILTEMGIVGLAEGEK